MTGPTQAKPARTAVPIHDLLALRWSGRAFDEHCDPDGVQIAALLEAARWAPSCYGDQPWRYLLFRRREEPRAWRQALECLAPGNRAWAVRAPLLLLALADTRYHSRAAENRWGAYDTGAAGLALCLQATALGLTAHQMGGFDAELAQRRFEVPERFRPMAFIAVGRQLPADRVPEALRESEAAPRRRRALEEQVFLGKWGVPLEVSALLEGRPAAAGTRNDG